MQEKPQIADVRGDYRSRHLEERDIGSDPIDLAIQWLDDAVTSKEREPTAMALSTVSPDGKPSTRMVLLKGLDDNGFLFYTNRESRKGRDIDGNPYVALTFWWPTLERQLRAEGRVELVEDELSDGYFATRPRESRIGAWASKQSQPVADRDELLRAFKRCEEQFAAEESIPRPPYWGGYRVIPERIEFWQGQPARMHDRLVYHRLPGRGWNLVRLSP